MQTYLYRRLIQAVFVLILATFVVFLIMRLLPGDPVLLYVSQDEYTRMTSVEEIEALRHEFGLDKPLLLQYVYWIGGVTRGDLGKSIFMGTTVGSEIARALPISIHLGLVTWFISHVIGPVAGTICAVRRGKWSDTVITVLANIGICAPIFWVGILLIYTFGLHLGWLPIQGYVFPWEDFWESTRKAIMPAFCLALPHMAGSTRQTRSSMLETIRQDYIRTAWSKGLRERTVVMRHAVRNGIIPVVTMAGMAIPRIFGGQVLIETVFNIPGMGRLAVDALFTQDYAVVQGTVLVIAVIVVLSNFVVDVSYGWIDPRVRYQ